MARSRFAEWKDAPEDFYSFNTFGMGGRGHTVTSIIDEATPELMALSRRFPQTFSAALSSLSWHLKNVIQVAMTEGNAAGTVIQETSRVHRYRRLDWARGEAHENNYDKLKLKKRLGWRKQQGRENMMFRWKGGKSFQRNEKSMGGHLMRAIRYQKTKKYAFEIGAVSKSAAIYLAAVQGGQWRGEDGYFHSGPQEITPGMRRLYWAAGVPLSSKKSIVHPKRPLIYPIFRAEQPYMVSYVIAKMQELLISGASRLKPGMTTSHKGPHH